MQIKKSNSKGFTLIELLIVIIIIGILAAIAFVAYSGSQSKAHRASAESTLSEVKNKLAEYNADNGNYPTTLATFDTWMASADGGNNTTLSTTYVGPGYTYTASPADCNNTDADCTGFTITASASNLNFTGDDVTVKN